jgi:hypothetical protein
MMGSRAWRRNKSLERTAGQPANHVTEDNLQITESDDKHGLPSRRQWLSEPRQRCHITIKGPEIASCFAAMELVPPGLVDARLRSPGPAG